MKRSLPRLEYMNEEKKKVQEKIYAPENGMRGITEETGLRILEALYVLIELETLRQMNTDGAEGVNPATE